MKKPSWSMFDSTRSIHSIVVCIFIAAFILIFARVAMGQTAPTTHFTLIGVVGNTEITHDQTLDYGSSPPAKVTVQNHNGAGLPECNFSAISDHGSSQYQIVGGNNGYDTSGGYLQPRALDIPLSVPVVFTLTLDCHAGGKVTAIVKTELPPPPPASPPPAPAPVVPPTPASTPAPSPKPTPPPVVKSPPPIVKSVAPKPTPAKSIAPTPSPTPTPDPTPTIAILSTPILSTPIVEPVATVSPTTRAVAPSHHRTYNFKPLAIGVLVLAWLFGIIWWRSTRRRSTTS